MNNSKVGDNLRTIRKSMGWGQKELADRCGWKSASRVANYECGSRRISIDDLVLLSRALGVSLDEIVYGGERALSGENTSSIGEISREMFMVFSCVREGKQGI
jgi:transcriptional regulator with XRE-family HTH domain